jgi:hypothetical protein
MAGEGWAEIIDEDKPDSTRVGKRFFVTPRRPARDAGLGWLVDAKAQPRVKHGATEE